MKILCLREGASSTIIDGLLSFTGAAGSEFLNTRRTSPTLPPSHVLEVKPATVYKIYSGIAFEMSNGVPAVRPTLAYWQSYGVKVERVELEKVTDSVSEIIVYITAINSFSLKPRELMFEIYSILDFKHNDEITLFDGYVPNRNEGFVPVPKKSIQDAGARRQGDDTNTAKNVSSDELARKKLDEWLNSPDDKAGQTVTAGTPTGAIPSGISAARPGTEAQTVEKGGVRGIKS